MNRPIINITAEHLEAANSLVPSMRVHRTRVSPVDTLGGILGEFIFAQWLTGDWRNHEVGSNKGKADLLGLIEVKTSVYPFNENLNLVIREDYGAKFKDVYVQNIINVSDAYRKAIAPGTQVIICGFATHHEATKNPPLQMTMRGGLKTPYKVFRTPISELQSMQGFKNYLIDLGLSKGISLKF